MNNFFKGISVLKALPKVPLKWFKVCGCSASFWATPTSFYMNYRITQVGGKLWKTSSSSQHIQWDQASWGLMHLSSEYVQGWKLHNLSGQPALVFHRFNRENLHSYVQSEFLTYQFLPLVSHLIPMTCVKLNTRKLIYWTKNFVRADYDY